MGNAMPDGEDGSTFDLFDRWLAHRDEQAGTAGTDKAVDEPADEAAEAEAPAPKPLPQEPVVDPLFDAAFVDTIALADEPAPLAPDEHPDLMPLAASEPVAVLEVPSPPDPEPEPEPEPQPPARTDNVAVGRAIFAALATPSETAPAEAPVPTRVPAPVPVPAAEPSPAPTRATKPAKPPKAQKPAKPAKAPRVAKAPKAPKEPRTPRAARTPAAPEQVPHIVDFAPRLGTRRLVGLLLLVALAATAATGYAAYQDRATTMIGVAATLGVLTAILWAIWAASAVTTLSVRGGQLEIIRAGSRHRFDLASDYTPIDIVGEPGSRKWKVLFHRKSMAPFVVDASMVDPVEFTRVVRHYRPSA